MNGRNAVPIRGMKAVRLVYIMVVAIIFVAEIAIAIGAIGGAFVRGSIGDVLVIGLIYFLLRAISGLSPIKAAGFAIATGFLVEALQHIHLAEMIELRKGSVLYTVVGNTYSPSDLVMYVMGGALALATDQYALIPLLNKRRRAPDILTKTNGPHGS